MNVENDYYNFANIRILLAESFNKDELLTFCFDTTSFRPIYDNWSHENSKSDLIRTVIDHGYKRLEVDIILDWVKQTNLTRYETHKPYVNEKYLQIAEHNLLNVSILPNNQLGNGIILGGEYRGISLQLVATEWTAYGVDRQIRSGWLFIPQWTANHALTFYKIHIFDNGNGYVHIVDTTDPAHNVFLITSVGMKVEKTFHYLVYPKDTWQFTWK